jgi:LL-diaminopimelate aminotransferase
LEYVERLILDMLTIEKADRIKQLPPYLFKEIDRMREEVRMRGVDIINLGVGDPDLPTPRHIVEKLYEAAQNPENHQYPAYSGMKDFNECVARWYKRRFGVQVDAETQVCTLIGSKEGLAHLPLAFINSGDTALVPDPAYPVYRTATLFAGGASYFMPLRKENRFLPDLESIPEDIAAKSKLMFLNYPNNPTAAVADLEFFQQVVRFAERHGIMVVHDNAYSEVAFDGYTAPSFLQADGAMELGIEFHSLSKTYNMTGWRIGFAVGNAEIISALGQVKSNIDSGAFNAVQIAGIAAMEGDQSAVQEMRALYQERRDILVEGLRAAGISLEKPRATFYLWVETPRGFTSSEFTKLLLTRAGIVTTPGNGFGEAGEGFVRMALTVDRERIKEAVERIRKLPL